MKPYLIFIAALVFSACTTGNKVNRAILRDVRRDTAARVFSLTQPSDKAFVLLVPSSGKKILLQNTGFDSATVFHTEIRRDTAERSFTARAFTSSLHAAADDEFKGSVRGTVKTTYSDKPFEKFASVAKLYQSLKPAEFMNDLNIGNKDERSAFEDRNVIIRKAYLYTITIETDNDLHLLIGNTPVYDPQKTRVFNAEIPGVPKNGDAATKKHIRDLRENVLSLFNGIPECGKNGYLQQNHKIRISGSLFYDTHHKTNPAKCNEVEGESAWEMHPVWKIK